MTIFKMKKKIRFPFSDSPNTAAFSCCHVVNGERPILYVSHDVDGYWQFLCGEQHTDEQARLVSLYSIYEKDKTVSQIADLDYSCCAEREKVGGQWKKGKK